MGTVIVWENQAYVFRGMEPEDALKEFGPGDGPDTEIRVIPIVGDRSVEEGKVHMHMKDPTPRRWT